MSAVKNNREGRGGEEEEHHRLKRRFGLKYTETVYLSKVLKEVKEDIWGRMSPRERSTCKVPEAKGT